MAQNNRQMKEQLLQADNDQRKLLDYERMKSTLEKELDISDHHIGELIVTIYDVFAIVYRILGLTERLGSFTVEYLIKPKSTGKLTTKFSKTTMEINEMIYLPS